jgi:hypothetical protein
LDHESTKTNRLEILFEEASGDQPPPQEFIPKQKFPTVIRRSLQLLIWPFMLLDLSMQKVAKLIIRPPYKQIGKCKRRGNCCRYILMRKPEGILGKIHYFWSMEINGFYRRQKSEEVENEGVIILGCRYLRQDGGCGNYRFRPLICRQWPIIEYFGEPRILKGCGFQAKKR